MPADAKPVETPFPAGADGPDAEGRRTAADERAMIAIHPTASPFGSLPMRLQTSATVSRGSLRTKQERNNPLPQNF
jgi:hypothetical protein